MEHVEVKRKYISLNEENTQTKTQILRMEGMGAQRKIEETLHEIIFGAMEIPNSKDKAWSVISMLILTLELNQSIDTYFICICLSLKGHYFGGDEIDFHCDVHEIFGY